MRYRSDIPSALLCVTEGRLMTALTAVNRAHTFSLENVPATLFLPSRVTRRAELNDSRVHNFLPDSSLLNPSAPPPTSGHADPIDYRSMRSETIRSSAATS